MENNEFFNVLFIFIRIGFLIGVYVYLLRLIYLVFIFNFLKKGRVSRIKKFGIKFVFF